MSITALSEYTRIAKYARYLPEQQRRETWDEQITRVFDMHRTKYADKLEALDEWLEIAEKAVRSKRVLGSQRVLQFGGTPIFKHNARLYNCVVSFADRPRFFQEYMYLLLCGCGAGFSVQRHHTAKLPGISMPSRREKVFTVPDTIEGWADAIGVLLSSYLDYDQPFPEYAGVTVEFDYSLIRPAGAPLSSGAKAPGPDGLKRSIQKILAVLNSKAWDGRLESINIYDICMHAADAVISGGVRRSATICVFSADDDDMLNAKTGSWFVDNPQRGRSNNSALLLRDQTSAEDFAAMMQKVKQFGEPGFVWSDSTELLVNPCVEIGMWPKFELPVREKRDMFTGKLIKEATTAQFSGWQFCNLCEINGKQCKTPEDFYGACVAAAVLGTMQAGYTTFPYLEDPSQGFNVTEEIVKREALLGVSITGMMDSPEVLFDPEVLQAGAATVKATNLLLAEIIGINPAARTTCVKPAGSSSCVLGTASGIHPHHSKRYFRRVQANVLENPVQHFKTVNPRAVETSVWDPNGQTEVVTFLCEVPRGAKTKNQVDALKLLDHVKLVQQNWVVPGTTEKLCTKPWLRHNVSNTINVKPDEWDAVTDFIYNNRNSFAGVALLPHSGDKDYPQAPFTNVLLPSEILREYGSGAMFASGLIESAVNAFDRNLWAAADALLGVSTLVEPQDPGPNLSIEEILAQTTYITQIEWVASAHKYADRFFEGDLKQMTYCLKDVYNLNLWEKLSREYKDVVWTDMIEVEDNVKPEQDLACAGGACDLSPEFLAMLYGDNIDNNSKS